MFVCRYHLHDLYKYTDINQSVRWNQSTAYSDSLYTVISINIITPLISYTVNSHLEYLLPSSIQE